MKQRILVWDLPTRFFHWLLVFDFVGVFISAQSERWIDLHILLGYTLLGLLGFRIIWGFVGSRYARFSDFVTSPATAIRHHLQPASTEDHPVGHNPAGAAAILLLLLLGMVSGISGWALYQEIGADWVAECHEVTSNIMLAVVLIHILGVLVVSYRQKENLIAAMITGRKYGHKDQAIPGDYRLTALLLLAVLLAYWLWAWPESKDLQWLRGILKSIQVMILNT